ncbi:MAG: hypothetical protein ACKVHE_34300 [Planctomycetales bacterium]
MKCLVRQLDSPPTLTTRPQPQPAKAEPGGRRLAKHWQLIAPGSIHLELVPGAPTAVRDAVGIIANSALLLFHSSRPLPIRPTFPPLFE